MKPFPNKHQLNYFDSNALPKLFQSLVNTSSLLQASKSDQKNIQKLIQLAKKLSSITLEISQILCKYVVEIQTLFKQKRLQCDQLIQQMKITKFNEGEHILMRNQKITKIYIILSGHAGIYFYKREYLPNKKKPNSEQYDMMGSPYQILLESTHIGEHQISEIKSLSNCCTIELDREFYHKQMYNIISNPEMNQRVNLIKSNALLKNLTLNKIGSFIQMSTLASFLANQPIYKKGTPTFFQHSSQTYSNLYIIQQGVVRLDIQILEPNNSDHIKYDNINNSQIIANKLHQQDPKNSRSDEKIKSSSSYISSKTIQFVQLKRGQFFGAFEMFKNLQTRQYSAYSSSQDCVLIVIPLCILTDIKKIAEVFNIAEYVETHNALIEQKPIEFEKVQPNPNQINSSKIEPEGRSQSESNSISNGIKNTSTQNNRYNEINPGKDFKKLIVNSHQYQQVQYNHTVPARKITPMNLHTVNTLQMNPSATFEPENSLSKFASILARPYHMSTELQQSANTFVQNRQIKSSSLHSTIRQFQSIKQDKYNTGLATKYEHPNFMKDLMNPCMQRQYCKKLQEQVSNIQYNRSKQEVFKTKFYYDQSYSVLRRYSHQLQRENKEEYKEISQGYSTKSSMAVRTTKRMLKRSRRYSIEQNEKHERVNFLKGCKSITFSQHSQN